MVQPVPVYLAVVLYSVLRVFFFAVPLVPPVYHGRAYTGQRLDVTGRVVGAVSVYPNGFQYARSRLFNQRPELLVIMYFCTGHGVGEGHGVLRIVNEVDFVSLVVLVVDVIVAPPGLFILVRICLELRAIHAQYPAQSQVESPEHACQHRYYPFQVFSGFSFNPAEHAIIRQAFKAENFSFYTRHAPKI